MDRSGERGVILIIVAVALTSLILLSAFVVDFGVLWLARTQAQNAADAGALAGATALVYDDPDDFTNAGPAYVTASQVTASNAVFGGTHGVEVFVDPTATWDPPAPPVCVTNGDCVQVNVFQDGSHGSSLLPTYFARVFGVTSQGIRATATARAAEANASGCMRPWFITELYTDSNGNNHWDAGEPIPGYRIPDSIGNVVTFHLNGGPSSYGQLDVGSGGNAIEDAIKYCHTGTTFAIGQTALTKPGNTLGPERQGIEALMAWDPSASWDGNEVVNSCANSGTCVCGAGTCPYGGAQSPRVVQAAICSPTEAQCDGSNPGAGTITITNILSFFVTGYTPTAGSLDIHAVIISSAGLQVPGPGAGPGNSFIQVPILVR
jgi:Flp pilus assembly protein TadG